MRFIHIQFIPSVFNYGDADTRDRVQDRCAEAACSHLLPERCPGKKN